MSYADFHLLLFCFYVGFNPMWKETFEKELLMPELAMIRFVVFDEDVGSRDDFIGQFSLPFTSVRPGMLLYLSLLYCLKY